MISLFLSLALSHLAFAEVMPLSDYEYGVSSDTTILGATNATQGDVLNQLVIIPMQPTVVGNVWLHDGGGLSQKIFDGGAVTDMRPILISLGMRSVSGDWSVSTGANVRILGIGRFR